jgi:hypothetical protein
MLTDMLVKQLLVRHACQPEIGKALEELLGYEGQVRTRESGISGTR